MKKVSYEFKNEPDNLSNLTMILGFEEDQRYMIVLCRLLENPGAFKSAAKNVIEDMEQAKKLPEY